ncbi:MAG: ATP-binding protein [Bacteroidota bacterium]
MKVNRIIFSSIKKKFFKGKTIVLIGPRQTGKTTLIKNVLDDFDEYLFLDGDDISTRQLLENINTQQLKRIIGKHTIVFIDEAQRINHIGITAKIITDQFKQIQLILSGSSAFDLNNKISESLTGRKWEYKLFPISWEEYLKNQGYVNSIQQLNDRLIYGMYPDVINNTGEEIEVLKTLTNSYLYKDILSLSTIKKPEILEKLVQALAYQMGSEVSYNELAKLLRVNKETIGNYIELLEKAFVVFRLKSFSRNLRNEIKFNKKVFFYDNGIRNAIITNFNSIELRNDKGALWENFLISERIKYFHYHHIYTNYYFWRTKQQQEIDWIEEKNGAISAYEFKWNKKSKTKIPKKFVEAYGAKTQIIDRENFIDFVTLSE